MHTHVGDLLLSVTGRKLKLIKIGEKLQFQMIEQLQEKKHTYSVLLI